MNTNKIERAAVRVVEEYIDKCPKLEPYITSNDKTPIWDGDIYIFNEEGSHTVNKFRNRVPLQIKGTENGKEDSFRIGREYLEGFKADRGCAFFLCQIGDESHRILYALLSADKITDLLQTNNKTIVVELNIIPTNHQVFEQEVILFAEKRNKVKIDNPAPKEIKSLVNSFQEIKQHLKKIEDKSTKYDIEAAIVSIENLNEDGTAEWRDKFVYYAQKVLELADKCIKKYDLFRLKINWGVYLFNQKLYHLAEQSFISSMKDVQAKKETRKFNHSLYIADIFNNLGLIHSCLNRFYEAEEEYKNALNEYRILYHEDSNTYSHNIATILNNLGNLYATLHRFDDSEKAYKEALDVYNDLSSTNPLLYEKHVATVLNNLANLHNRYNLSDVAETEYKKALEIYRKLSKDDSQFLSDTAMTLHNLAALYDTKKNISRGRKKICRSTHYISPIIKRQSL